MILLKLYRQHYRANNREWHGLSAALVIIIASIAFK